MTDLRFATIALLVALSGCRGWPNHGAPLAANSAIDKVPPGPAVAEELPARQAAQACLGTAESLYRKGHDREAILLYERARKLDPSLGHVARPLAILYERQGDIGRAQAEYELALAAAGTDADVLNDFGFFHYRQGNYSRAETYLNRALQIAPDHPRAAMNLGLVLAHQGRHDEAFVRFEASVGAAEAHANLGIILAKTGRTDEAVVALRQAIELDPTLKQPQVVLAYLESETNRPAVATEQAGYPPLRGDLPPGRVNRL
jgi:Tfp pilus assembly protein PilF